MKKKNLIAIVAALILIGTIFVAMVQADDEVVISTNAIELTDKEEQGILYMREEEKLARDVYLTFYEMYNSIPIFYNIAQSEQKHMDAIKTLIDRYGLEDPTYNKGLGEFTNQVLQDLYTDLIAQGSTLTTALKVGAEIEEIDIIDLKEYMSQTDKADILVVYGNLLKGSENHLRAFIKWLEYNNVTYEPKYLNQDDFDDIIEDTNNGNKMFQNKQNRKYGILQELGNRFKNRLRENFEKRSLFRNRQQGGI